MRRSGAGEQNQARPRTPHTALPLLPRLPLQRRMRTRSCPHPAAHLAVRLLLSARGAASRPRRGIALRPRRFAAAALHSAKVEPQGSTLRLRPLGLAPWSSPRGLYTSAFTPRPLHLGLYIFGEAPGLTAPSTAGCISAPDSQALARRRQERPRL